MCVVLEVSATFANTTQLRHHQLLIIKTMVIKTNPITEHHLSFFFILDAASYKCCFHLRLSLSSTTIQLGKNRMIHLWSAVLMEAQQASFGHISVISGAWGDHSYDHTEEQSPLWPVTGYLPLTITSSLSEIPPMPPRDQKRSGRHLGRKENENQPIFVSLLP